MKSDKDTITALATPPGRGAVAVLRISGPAVPSFFRPLLQLEPAPRRAVRARFLAADGSFIDDGVAVYFPAPTSYTGEHVLELQGHGGPVVQRLLLQRCLELGARPAEPGEFTRRAYLNGKLDLAQAEAVADLIDASTAAAARGAMRSLTGAFSARIHELVTELTDLRALVEGTLDFPEEDIDFLGEADATARLARVRVAVEDVRRASQQGSLLREGARVVLVGRPNVGKSSILNRLAGEDIAIVTDIPGTTRDVIRQAIDLDGLPVYIVDTAGLRESEDPVEQAGMARTWAAACDADAVLLVIDARAGVAAEDRAIADLLPPELPRMIVANKIDLLVEDRAGLSVDPTVLAISAKVGTGIDELRLALAAAVGWRQHEEGVFLARSRHLLALERAATELAVAAKAAAALELYAEHLRLAQKALAEITGEFTADDLLGEIFGRFCIGK